MSDVEEALNAIEPAAKQDDARALLALFAKVTGEEPQMWSGIFGFGDYETTYASGRKVHSQRSGFATRKAKHSLHLMGGYCDEAAGTQRKAMLADLGKHTQGASCLYINKLADVDMEVLEKVIAHDWVVMNRLYPE